MDRCRLHEIHVPKPHILMDYVVTPELTIKVCPTGAANMDYYLDQRIAGKIPLGRRGQTGYFAETRYEWYKDTVKRSSAD